jgi:hypothetical protein
MSEEIEVTEGMVGAGSAAFWEVLTVDLDGDIGNVHATVAAIFRAMTEAQRAESAKTGKP